MAEIINGVKVPFIPVIPDSGINRPKTVQKGSRFDDIFKTELEKIKFSSHAAKRLESRNINLNDSDINKLKDAINKAESKGAKDSLVMMDKTAFIVNVPNRTVITAIEISEKEDNIFTNIDSVVFAK